jgi:signal transduction histidine kinase
MESLKIEISKRKRLEQAVDFISIQAEKATKQKQKEAKEAVAEITKRVSELARDLMIDLENKIRDVKDDFKKLQINNSQDFNLVAERRKAEEEISKERDKATIVLESVIKQLQNVYWNKSDDGSTITSEQITDAMSEELEELRERIQTDIELSQLGLAVGVIHHEFNSTVNSIRHSLRDLKAWTEVDIKLEGVYNNIKVNFEHLDGYLTLFTPLNRRLNRKREEIASKDIKIFLLDLFGARLERHNIQLKHTKGFESRSLSGYRSTFYPVFVNLIDNAIHWLNQSTESEKTIRLHADDSGFYISNNGPEISIKDANRIFELGFTRKLNGRGMGLHISKEVLEAENYKIILDSPRDKSNVTFKIASITE